MKFILLTQNVSQTESQTASEPATNRSNRRNWNCLVYSQCRRFHKKIAFLSEFELEIVLIEFHPDSLMANTV